MKQFHIKIKDRTYQVAVGDTSGSTVSVVVDGETFEVEVERPSAVIAKTPDAVAPPAAATPPLPAAPAPLSGANGSGRIVAPMPGKIIQVMVRVGDSISFGDEVCILEAMKMQQSIRAPKGGVVREVGCAAGQMVSYGHLIVDLS